jgi:hypothetical protein
VSVKTQNRKRRQLLAAFPFACREISTSNKLLPTTKVWPQLAAETFDGPTVGPLGLRIALGKPRPEDP